MLSLLKKGPSANKVPAEKIQATYGRYRMQALLSVFLGYLAYYIVRNNFTLSTPYLKEQLDLSATQIGLLSSCMLIAYGISKGVMSSLADKASPKVFMACGLVLCAIVNVGLGFSTAFWVFAALVVLNGLFQGMGIATDGHGIRGDCGLPYLCPAVSGLGPDHGNRPQLCRRFSRGSARIYELYLWRIVRHQPVRRNGR